jgi:hypothetical protein
LFAELDAQDQGSLLAFAEFLASRETAAKETAAVPAQPIKPEPIPRPAKESVVKAIQRLSASYHMLQRDKMLDETSSLMMSHIMQGRDAKSVIDDIEKVFERHYQIYLKQD